MSVPRAPHPRGRTGRKGLRTCDAIALLCAARAEDHSVHQRRDLAPSRPMSARTAGRRVEPSPCVVTQTH
eukprot:835313-Rhodomonas_salina.2